MLKQTLANDPDKQHDYNRRKNTLPDITHQPAAPHALLIFFVIKTLPQWSRVVVAGHTS
jgi:hypothetical protein